MPIFSFSLLDKLNTYAIQWYCMVGDGEKYNLNLLRGWKRSQLRLLREFAVESIMSQARLSGASGMAQGSTSLGGWITPFTRANLIEKVGRDEDGNYIWKLNELKVEKKTLLEFLDQFDLEK